MTRKHVLSVALLATVAWAGGADAGLYYDVFPASADGSMNNWASITASGWTEGYAINGTGNARLAKSYHHMAFFGFDGYSDGPDGVPQGRNKGGVNDSEDGVLLTDWLAGRKVVRASLYFRDASWNTCDNTSGQGYWINDPVQIVGFRVANAGNFVDRGDQGTGFTGAGGSYTAPLLEGGENAPPAWRMGPPTVDRNGTLGYTRRGDIGPGGEYYILPASAAENAGQEVHAGQTWFDTAGAGFGGFSSSVPGIQAPRFAFSWIVANAATTGQMVNSDAFDWTDCTGNYGEQEPRDFGNDGTGAEGWYAASIDRAIVEAMGKPDAEVKGLVLDASGAPNVETGQPWNNTYWTRDQGGGTYGPYLTVTATLAGDINNDGTVNVIDLLRLANAWLSNTSSPNWDVDADLKQDGMINVMDLLALANDWLKTIP